jgi:spore coat protein A, manganese oxidase
MEPSPDAPVTSQGAVGPDPATAVTSTFSVGADWGAKMDLTRRDVMKLSLAGGAAFVLPMGAGGVARTALSDPLRSLPRPFRAGLPVPTPLQTTSRSATTDVYRITMREADAQIVPGLTTRIWGYNGSFPGPMLRVEAGRKVRVDYVNHLRGDASIHTHGAYVDGDSDGHPNDLIAPGATKSYFFGNDETARTQWFHDHAMHHTAENVYHGLAGLYLITDEFERSLPLPSGAQDVALVIQDRLFNQDGSFDYPVGALDHSTNGVLGNVVLVNGKPWPRFEVAARKYRFRILNGSNARAYRLALSGGRPFMLIGTEGGLVHRPVRLGSLPISPAERYEIVVDFSDVPVGSSVMLRNLNGRDETSRVMRFDVVRKARDDARVPAVLRPPAEQLDPTHQPTSPERAVRTRRFLFKRKGGMWTINGKVFDAGRLDAIPREGDTEIWELTNGGGGWIHPIHLHLLNFKILDRNGRPPPAHERGLWKETVFLGPNDSVRVLMKWPRIPIGPDPGKFLRTYVFHCHVVEHEDHDMMLQMRVDPRV